MKRQLSAMVALVMLAVACGRDRSPIETAPAEPRPGESAAPDAAAFPVEVAGVTVDSEPMRIVSLSTVSTEVLFAVGAGDQVVAVDSQSTFPPEAPVTDLSSFEPNIEAIAAFEPDLVFTSFDPGDLVAGLETLGIPTILHAGVSSLDEAWLQIEQVGAATGNQAGATDLVAGMQAELTALAAEAPDSTRGLTYFHELDNTFYTATSSTFIGEIYGLAGLSSIADPADADGFGYPQLSEEFVLDADPDFIFLADTLYGESAETVAERPGWDRLTAVSSGNVVELDSDTASRWGPRIVDFFADIVAGLTETAAG
jgi:iron complex transport system substrate-binding protein